MAIVWSGCGENSWEATAIDQMKKCGGLEKRGDGVEEEMERSRLKKSFGGKINQTQWCIEGGVESDL